MNLGQATTQHQYSFSTPRIPIWIVFIKFKPDYALRTVTKVEKPQRKEKLKRFCAEGIVIHMLRSKIVKSRL